MTQQAWTASSGHDTAKRGHDTTSWATIQPTTWPTALAGVRQLTHMAWPLGSVSRYNRLYRDRRRLGCATHPAIWQQRAATRLPVTRACTQRHGRGGLRHGRCWAYDTATCTPRHDRDTAGLGEVRAAWVRVCTWCTQPSLDSVHHSESLFGTLFMNTVHEHCSRGFKKKKKKYFFLLNMI